MNEYQSLKIETITITNIVSIKPLVS